MNNQAETALTPLLPKTIKPKLTKGLITTNENQKRSYQTTECLNFEKKPKSILSAGKLFLASQASYSL